MTYDELRFALLNQEEGEMGDLGEEEEEAMEEPEEPGEDLGIDEEL